MAATYNDIDWKTLRANAMAQKGWKKKSSDDWDKKALSFSERTRNHGYVDLFLKHLPLTPSTTILDIGSGPGTLSLPIAKKVAAVTAIDFSKGMLDILQSHAVKEKISNITTSQCAWEDDWQQKGIKPHDIAIASRSLGVNDLETALLKLDRFANKYVFLTDRVGATPFEAAAFNAIGRTFETGPDYIYTLNFLYKLGIHPNVTVLEIDRQVRYSSMEKAMESFSWMFGDLTTAENSALEKYIDTRVRQRDENGLLVERETPVRWALIWWQKM